MKLRITTRNSKCPYADCKTFCYAECRSAECRYAECKAPILKSFLEHLRNLIYNFKYILNPKHSSLFCTIFNDEEKTFYNIGTFGQFHKTFFSLIYATISILSSVLAHVTPLRA